MRYNVGDRVAALSTERGLRAGSTYVVTGAKAVELIITRDVTYVLQPLERGEQVVLTNGVTLLQPA